MIKHGLAKDDESSSEECLNEILAVKDMPEGVEKHEKMVLYNPDDYNSWNVLKARFLESNERDAKRQLQLTQKAIQVNPKSYATWFHRFLFFKKANDDREMEQKLCKLLLKLDPRNFHCWNYCLKNNFSIDIDLHNFTTMHFRDFKEDYLFVDPDDEGGWRLFEKRHTNDPGYQGIIRTYEDKTEVLFEHSFTGQLLINDIKVESTVPTKRILLSRQVMTPETLLLNDKKAIIKLEACPKIIEEVIRLAPDCTHALKKKMLYTIDKNERVLISSKLQKIDSIRKNYYQMLEKVVYKTYLVFLEVKN
ncbi:hypothetical protein GINT2_001265 [Glugoides intestinalis]